MQASLNCFKAAKEVNLHGPPITKGSWLDSTEPINRCSIFTIHILGTAKLPSEQAARQSAGTVKQSPLSAFFHLPRDRELFDNCSPKDVGESLKVMLRSLSQYQVEFCEKR